MLRLSEIEMTWEGTTVIYFKILSWNHEDNEKYQDSQYSNTNMEVLWLEPTCAIDGIEWEIT
jgi:hypothetical protein